jgi:hypothetical protein
MAIWLPRYRVLALEVPRTGSVALSKGLVVCAGGVQLKPRHMNTHEAIHALETWVGVPVLRESILVAATVRNPFDYLVTEWSRLTGYWYADAVADSNSWVYQLESEGVLAYYERSRLMCFEQWIEEVACPSYSRFCLDYTRDVDVLLRYESIQDDIRQLLRRRGHRGDVYLPRVNITKSKRAYYEYYSPKSRELVEKHFGQELSRHGYGVFMEIPRVGFRGDSSH